MIDWLEGEGATAARVAATWGVLAVALLLNRTALMALGRLRRFAYRGSDRKLAPGFASGAGPFQLLTTVLHTIGYAVFGVIAAALVAVAALAPAPWFRSASTDSERAAAALAWVALALGLGLSLERLSVRSVLAFMARRTAGRGADAAPAGGGERPGAVPERWLVDGGEALPLSDVARKKVELGRTYARRVVRRRRAGPLAALLSGAGSAWLAMSAAPPDVRSRWLAVFAALGVACLALEFVERRWRVAGRAPLRPLRLGAGVVLSAPLLALGSVLALLRLPRALQEPWDQRAQWKAITRPVRVGGRVVRSVAVRWASLGLLLPWATSRIVAPASDPAGLAAAGAVAGLLAAWGLLGLPLRGGPPLWHPLVFLRVFGDREKGRFLFEKVVPHWTGIGTVSCISAPDVSVHQLEAEHAFDALLGQTRNRFPEDESDVWSDAFVMLRGGKWSEHLRGRVGELHCFDDTWKAAIDHLLVGAQTAVVLMDLRGFGAENAGCVHEIRLLRDELPVGSAVFLVDDRTDMKALDRVFREVWCRRGASSANSATRPDPLRLFVVRRPDHSTARRLAGLLCEAADVREQQNRGNARERLRRALGVIDLLARDAADQLRRVGGSARGVRKLLLLAGEHLDGDAQGYLWTWKAVDEAQSRAIALLHDRVDEIVVDPAARTVKAVRGDERWRRLRAEARKTLGVLRRGA